MIRADNARENMPKELPKRSVQIGILIEPSPPYAPEGNGTDERLVQEHWTRTAVMFLATNVPANLWDEALYHTNWLSNRLPSSRIDLATHLQQ